MLLAVHASALVFAALTVIYACLPSTQGCEIVSQLDKNYGMRQLRRGPIILSTVEERIKSLLIAKSTYQNKEPKIIGGSAAKSMEFPSYAVTKGSTLCGATLINKDILLTAASCGAAWADGAWIGGTNRNGTGGEFATVKQSVPHPSYDPSSKDNDIMIVKLNSASAAPVQAYNIDATTPRPGSNVTVIGYGATSALGGSSDNLLKVVVFSGGDDRCKAYWGDKYKSAIHICAGAAAGGKDSCSGDTGGPLMTSTKLEVGIISYGDCGKPNSTSIYTRISAYEKWLKDTICNVSDFRPSHCNQTISVTNAPVVTLSPTPTAPTPQTVPTTPTPTLVVGPKVTTVPATAPVTTASATKLPTLNAPTKLPAKVSLAGGTNAPTSRNIFDHRKTIPPRAKKALKKAVAAVAAVTVVKAIKNNNINRSPFFNPKGKMGNGMMGMKRRQFTP